MTEFRFLYLVNGEKSGQGYWEIGLTSFSNPLKANKSFLECYRKELIGLNAANKILNAIEINIENLLNDCLNDGYMIEIPPEGISYDLPLTVLEEIYDFWLNLFKDKDQFEKVLGLLVLRKKINFLHPSIAKGLKGFTAEWVQKLDRLHAYRPPSAKIISQKKPMWEEPYT